MGKLIELAQRCEKATEADREIDVEIALEYPPTARRLRNLMAGSPHNTIAEIAKDADRASPHIHIPRFTASFDAAMTLIPEGWEWELENTGSETFGPFVAKFGQLHDVEAKTLPLAITAAALRARSQSTPDILRSEVADPPRIK